MEIFKPKMYCKSIFDIHYQKLKKMGIHCLIFDLDNTLGFIDYPNCSRECKELIETLKKDFLVLICSNNLRGRVRPYMRELGVDGVCFSLKPFRFGLFRIMRRYQLKREEMCLIGDQVLTDILAGNRFNIQTILVDPLSEKDLKITGINRKIENVILKNYQKRGIFERGKYYES